MVRRKLALLWVLLTLPVGATHAADETLSTVSGKQCVVLLHGLARTPRSMRKVAQALQAHGYGVSSPRYASRQATIEVLSQPTIDAGLHECRAAGADTIHFVTHSLGGILLRFYLTHHQIPELGRTVMLAPPNHGSEVVDRYRNTPGFVAFNGPAILQLGTDADSVPLSLGPATFDVGIIAGTRTINVILSQSLPNPDDGKVSVASAKLDGMRDFITLPTAHPFIMKHHRVIEQTLHFLQHGEFARSEPDRDR